VENAKTFRFLLKNSVEEAQELNLYTQAYKEYTEESEINHENIMRKFAKDIKDRQTYLYLTREYTKPQA